MWLEMALWMVDSIKTRLSLNLARHSSSIFFTHISTSLIRFYLFPLTVQNPNPKTWCLKQSPLPTPLKAARKRPSESTTFLTTRRESMASSTTSNSLRLLVKRVERALTISKTSGLGWVVRNFSLSQRLWDHVVHLINPYWFMESPLILHLQLISHNTNLFLLFTWLTWKYRYGQAELERQGHWGQCLKEEGGEQVSLSLFSPHLLVSGIHTKQMRI